MAEKYKPSAKEVADAEATMTDEQKDASKERARETVGKLEEMATELKRQSGLARTAVEQAIKDGLADEFIDFNAPRVERIEQVVKELKEWTEK